MVKGLFILKPEKLLWQSIDDESKIGNEDVKIKVIYGGICGSDVAVYHGNLPHAKYPLIPGHEILGEVIEVGEKSFIEVGTRVILIPNTFCATCEACQQGNTNICPNKASFGININGGFVEQLIVPEKYVIPVPNTLSNERAVLVEPLAVVIHAFQKVFFKDNASLAVIGCGTEGMLAIALATYLEIDVTAIDIREEKLMTIKEEYPNVKVCHANDVQANEYDVVFELAGAKESFEQSIQFVKPGGSIVAVGFTNIAEISVVEIVRKEITIKGSIIYNAPEDFITGINYLLDEKFRVEPIISEIISVAEFKKAYKMASSGKYRKIILKF